MHLQQILRLQWKSTPHVVAYHYQKKKSSDAGQIDYVCIAGDWGILQRTVPIDQKGR